MAKRRHTVKWIQVASGIAEVVEEIEELLQYLIMGMEDAEEHKKADAEDRNVGERKLVRR